VSAPNITDLATSLITVAPAPALSGTEITITTGEGNRFSDNLNTPFNATVVPDNTLPTVDNSEIVLVTNVTGDVFTITRAQGITTAKAIATGWRIFNGIYADHVRGAYDRANHTGSQAISTVTGLQTALDGKSSVGHAHDDRYYTESEVDGLISAIDTTNGFTATGDEELTGTYAYVAYSHTDNRWFIYRRTRATNVRLYASGVNNYAANWANRSGLSYA